MMTNTSADLWIDPTVPLGDAAEVSGPFGGVCGPLGVDAKNVVPAFWFFSRSTFGLPSSLSLLMYKTRLIISSVIFGTFQEIKTKN